jgi:hypothetical protein
MKPSNTATDKASETMLSPREMLTRDTFTAAETAVFAMVTLMMVIATWLPPSGFWWIFGLGLCLAALNPAVIRLHSLTHPFFVSHLWRKWFLLHLPFWLTLLLYVLGQWNPSLSTIATPSEGNDLHTLAPPGSLWPTVASLGVGWELLGRFTGVYLVAVMLFIVPKSRAFFLRLLPWLGLNAVLLALLGYLQRAFGFEKLFGLFAPDDGVFFATFSSEVQWMAFAILWTGVLSGLCLLHFRLEKSLGDFSKGLGPWYGCGALVLLGTGMLCEPGIEQVIFWLTAAIMCGFFGWQFILSVRKKRIATVIPWIFSGGLATAVCLGLAWHSWQAGIKVDSSAMATAWEMLRARPWFGWGADPYRFIAPFFQSDFSDSLGPNAGSDALQWLSAYGWLGTFIILSLPLALLVKDLKTLLKFRLSSMLLLGLMGAFAFACVQVVFNHYGFALSFWLLFFSAIRWGYISRTGADRVDHTPYLIFSHPQSRT